MRSCNNQHCLGYPMKSVSSGSLTSAINTQVSFRTQTSTFVAIIGDHFSNDLDLAAILT